MKLSKKVLKELKLDKFIVFDLETTGLNSYTDKIIEISGIKYIDGELSEKFTYLINPERKLPDEITELTGIKDNDLLDHPVIEDILPLFLEFIKGFPLVGHNISFDLEFLEYNILFNELNKEYKVKRFYDTLLLSRTLYPIGPHNYKLITLADYFDFDKKDAHRAENDCIYTGNLFLKLVGKSLDLSIDTVNKLASIASKSNSYSKDFFVNLSNYYTKTTFTESRDREEAKFKDSFNNYVKRSELDKKIADILKKEDIADLIFKDNGLLKSNLEKYEYREEQHQLAMKCFEVFSNDKFLVSEAGTGVGKSYAYLIPTIIHAINTEEKVIISTNTKNLQEQIFYKDLAVLSKIFNNIFSAIILKGRSNYICKNRYESVLRDPKSHLNITNNSNEFDKFMPLIIWAEKTKTGDIEENGGFKKNLNFDVWNKVQSDKSYCLGKKCRFYKRCFLQKIRKSISKTNIIVINHSLLFSDIAAENAVLGKYDYLVIDEAHNIEAAATKYLAVDYHIGNLVGLCFRLSSKDGKKGALPRLEKSVTASKISGKNMVLDLIKLLKDKSQDLNEHGKDYFSKVSKFLLDNDDGRSTIIKKRFKKSTEIFPSEFDNEKNIFKSMQEEFINLIDRLKTFLKALDNDKLYEQDDLTAEFISFKDMAESLYDSFLFFDKTKRENYVFWYELSRYDRGVSYRLSAAPLNVSELLEESLYSKLKGAVLTSATLTIEKRFRYMLRKLGLANIPSEKIDTLMLGSTFDLEKQLKVITPTYFATPKNDSVFVNDIVDFIKMLANKFDRGTLALFTSYKQMNTVRTGVFKLFNKLKRILMVQGKDGSRTQLINHFKTVKNSFLFGTDSFWEGVDIPGDSLEALIIIKLPFAVPTDPVIQARIEEIEKEGKNSFMFYSVPEAILKFKQGIGRLIRSKTDTGIVYVLDSRAINTKWGQAFINSLPVKPIKAYSLNEVEEASK